MSDYLNRSAPPDPDVAASERHLPEIDPSEFDVRSTRIGILEYRLRRERCGEALREPVSNAELVELLDFYRDHPLPDDLRDIVCEALNGTRRGKKRGRPTETDATKLLQDYMLVFEYEKGLVRGKKIVPYLKERAKRTRRGADVAAHVTPQWIAARHVQLWLPAFRKLTPRAIANRVSKFRQEN